MSSPDFQPGQTPSGVVITINRAPKPVVRGEVIDSLDKLKIVAQERNGQAPINATVTTVDGKPTLSYACQAYACYAILTDQDYVILTVDPATEEANRATLQTFAKYVNIE